MLITTDTQTNATQAWERIQQPVHSSNQQPETLRLLAALDEGWQILEAANYLARGQNAEGPGYMLTLYHPQRRVSREWNVSAGQSMEQLLRFEGVLTTFNS